MMHVKSRVRVRVCGESWGCHGWRRALGVRGQLKLAMTCVCVCVCFV
jgi:hypothetical protein